MKIELLFVPGCPNHAPALIRLKEVLAMQGIEALVEEIAISDEDSARALGFPGSPTIRVNGNDIEGASTNERGTLACRLYRDAASNAWAGVPSVELIRKAVSTKVWP